MKYIGGKAFMSLRIAPLMQCVRKPGQAWVEPFVGGGSVIEKVDGWRIGGDIFRPTINALISIRDHADELPRDHHEITKDDYEKLRRGETDHPHKDWILFAVSFGAIYGGNYQGDHIKTTRRRSRRGNFTTAENCFSTAQKQSPFLQGVELHCCDYRALEIPDGALIYCDPPYRGTLGYKGTPEFDSDAFWQWAEAMTEKGHRVFVTEFQAPAHWHCIYEREKQIAIATRRDKDQILKTERLYTLDKSGLPDTPPPRLKDFRQAKNPQPAPTPGTEAPHGKP